MVTKTELLTLIAKYKHAEERNLHYSEILLNIGKVKSYEYKQNLKQQIYWANKQESIRVQLMGLGKIPPPMAIVKYTHKSDLRGEVKEFTYYGVQKEAIDLLFKLQFPNRALVEII